MLMLIIFINVFGLLYSSCKYGVGNPFQIYFFVWSFILILYKLTIDSWNSPVEDYFLFLFFPAILAVIILMFSTLNFHTDNGEKKLVVMSESINRLVLILQVMVFISLPFAYRRAVDLSGGGIFDVLGYTQLRASLIGDGPGYGVLGYFFVLSYVVSSVTVFLYRSKFSSIYRMLASLCVSFFYTYMATGRTFVLLFLVMLILPLIIDRVIGIRGIFFSLFVVVFLFVFLALMTNRGVSGDSELGENFSSFFENIRSYTVAPLLAFSEVIRENPSPAFGENTFRFFISIANGLGIGDFKTSSLIRDYVAVPDLTNVYTVYEPYFMDFSLFGVLVPALLLILHAFLYKKSIKQGGVWVFLYSASIYPLLMQFFQDQYFSLLSMWIQICFWFWLIFSMKENK